MNIKNYLVGDTVILTGEFTLKLTGEYVDPDLVTIKILNQRYEVVYQSQEVVKVSAGKYQYNYTIPMEYLGRIVYYEWYGEVAGKPSVNRGAFRAVFVDESK